MAIGGPVEIPGNLRAAAQRAMAFDAAGMNSA
jgi:hypothetical protein